MSGSYTPFTDGKQRIATEEDCHAGWGGVPDGKQFRCHVCGHKFQPGDKWRFLFDKRPTAERQHSVPNAFVCGDCDGTDEDVLRRLEDIMTAAWWLLEPDAWARCPLAGA